MMETLLVEMDVALLVKQKQGGHALVLRIKRVCVPTTQCVETRYGIQPLESNVTMEI